MSDPADFVDELQRRFQAMADCAPVMIWMSGPDKRCDFFNAGWLRFTGRTMQQELGNGWAEGVHPDDHGRCLETYVAAFDARRPFTMEYRLRRHDGAYRWVLDNGVPRHTRSGEFIGYIGSCVDVTEQREAREQLERSLRLQQFLVREIHHRVKNNLQLTVSLIAASARKFGAEVSAEFLGVRQKLVGLSKVFDRVFRGNGRQYIDLGEHIPEIATAIAAMQTREDIRLDVQVVAMTTHLDVAVPLSLITSELVANAFKHAFPEGRPGVISVRLDHDNGGRLIVRDDGIGLPEGSRSAGLALVRFLVQQIRATLTIDVNDGTGVTLLFDPRADDGDRGQREAA